MTAVIAIILCVLPFALALLAAQFERARDAQRTYEFERGWGPHNEHEWVRHPATGEVVCRYCPMPGPVDK